MLTFDGIDLIAPTLFDQPCPEVEALGATVWLWMHSAAHRDAPLHTLPTLLLPTIKSGQFVLGIEAGKPVFYLSWAAFDADAEARYLQLPRIHVREADWCCGDRLWILDWVTPFGHSRILRRLLHRVLMPYQCASWLYHKGVDRGGLSVMRSHGAQVSRATAQAWFTQHPLPIALPERWL